MNDSLLLILRSAPHAFDLDWLCGELAILPLLEDKPMAIIDPVEVENALAELVASGEVVKTEAGWRPTPEVFQEQGVLFTV